VSGGVGHFDLRECVLITTGKQT